MGKILCVFKVPKKKLPKKESERVSVVDSVDLDSLRIQMMGETNLSLVEEQGEVYGISVNLVVVKVMMKRFFFQI